MSDMDKLMIVHALVLLLCAAISAAQIWINKKVQGNSDKLDNLINGKLNADHEKTDSA